MTSSRRAALKRQSEAIRIAQSSLGFVWLLAFVVSIFSGGSMAPFWVAGALSILLVVGLAYFRYRLRRKHSSPDTLGR